MKRLAQLGCCQKCRIFCILEGFWRDEFAVGFLRGDLSEQSERNGKRYEIGDRWHHDLIFAESLCLFFMPNE